MKRFIGFVKKEFYHIFRDKRTMFILFCMPIAQIMLFGFAITNEINNVNIAILDKSKDNEIEFISRIREGREIKPELITMDQALIEIVKSHPAILWAGIVAILIAVYVVQQAL